MYDFDENLMQITNYETFGQLPDLFTMEDGTKVENEQQWQQRRKELYQYALEMQYGQALPEPEFLDIQTMNYGQTSQGYRITTGRRDKPVSFVMRVFRPATEGVYPTVINGDLCWVHALTPEKIAALTGQGIVYVYFDRTELAPDCWDSWTTGQLYQTYPEYNFGCMIAWAWGYSRCVDALEKLGFSDMAHIAFTGHSRGGKAALVAGVLDQRAFLVNPNNSGGGGAGCCRVHMSAIREDGKEERNENMTDLARPWTRYWFMPALDQYVGHPEQLPFDQHYLKALIAPRILLQTEAASDIWANPIGTWQTALAAKEAYKFLGVEENDLLYYRRGIHKHMPEDMALLGRIINQSITGKPFEAGSFRTPFRKPEPLFNWHSPK